MYKLEDLPGCAVLTRSVGGHIECKDTTYILSANIFRDKINEYALVITKNKFVDYQTQMFLLVQAKEKRKKFY